VNRRAALTLLLALALSAAAGAQDSGGQTGSGGQAAANQPQGPAATHVPKPYSPDEFAPWMRDLWRGEAVFVGSFPFSLFLTLEVYDTYRFLTLKNEDGTYNIAYAPWPIGSGATYDANETLWLAVSALSTSLVVSAVDFLLEHISGPRAAAAR
jgi:hypothetical protein